MHPARCSAGHGPVRRACAGVLTALGLIGSSVPAAQAAPLTVEVYRGGFATVNSFIFSNGKSLALLDAQRKVVEAEHLAERIRAKHLPLAYILISHGHTDHFTGLAYLHRNFPAAHIVVASEAIKRDIKAYALYMDQGGATAAEPALDPSMRPRSAANPDGFDYEGLIEVLPTPQLTLPGGGALEITSDYPPTEAHYLSTVYSPDLNALFLSDLGYAHVHPWLGDDATYERIAAWRAQLIQLRKRYAARHPSVYPGHGEPTDLRLVAEMTRYFDDFVAVTRHAGSRALAMQQMRRLYPDYGQADFFLKYSIENFVPEHQP